MDKKVYEIWLSLACTPDTATFPHLIESFDSAESIYNATEREIRSAVGSASSDCPRLNNKDLDNANRIYKFCITKGVGLLSYFDDEFPDALRDIPTPPVLLYYRGKLPDFNNSFCCAIVGTRSLSDYGRINAFHLGFDMAKAGAIIVSGMAIGIDAVAHAGALAAGGVTVAVLGSGIDVCYPAQHQRLAREIVKSGCVFTEYAPGTKPDKYNFPRRNRIISGLSRCTVVVEGRENSGSMITARAAKKQKRDVFAFPGNVNHEGSQATNLLIKNGANLCTAADDIVRFYEKDVPCRLNPFNLPEKRLVNMNAVIDELQVSAITYSDNLVIINSMPQNSYEAKRQKTTEKPKEKKPREANVKNEIGERSDKQEQKEIAPKVNDLLTVQDKPQLTFSPEAIKLYKRIPMDDQISIEALTNDDMSLRDVMRVILELEMAGCVVIAPGEKVRRKFK